APEGLQAREQRPGGDERGTRLLGGLTEGLQERRGAVGEGGQLRERTVDPRRGDTEVGEHRRCLFGEAPKAFERRAELFEKRREVGQVACERGALRGGGP